MRSSAFSGTPTVLIMSYRALYAPIRMCWPLSSSVPCELTRRARPPGTGPAPQTVGLPPPPARAPAGARAGLETGRLARPLGSGAGGGHAGIAGADDGYALTRARCYA